MKTIADLLNIDQTVPVTGHDNPWAIRNPIDEARDLYKMVRCGFLRDRSYPRHREEK